VNVQHGLTVVLLSLGQRKHPPSRSETTLKTLQGFVQYSANGYRDEHWRISMSYLTRVLVNEVEGNLESFEDAHNSMSNIQ
jgi:hypothetical protein